MAQKMPYPFKKKPPAPYTGTGEKVPCTGTGEKQENNASSPHAWTDEQMSQYGILFILAASPAACGPPGPF